MFLIVCDSENCQLVIGEIWQIPNIPGSDFGGLWVVMGWNDAFWSKNAIFTILLQFYTHETSKIVQNFHLEGCKILQNSQLAVFTIIDY